MTGSRVAALRPIGVNLTSMGVTTAWWVETARQLEAAGFSAVWCWDHFLSRGRKSTPVLECWTTLALAAAQTHRLRVGSFVSNVMNRHPSLLARMTATLQEASGGRVEVGIGIGGNAREVEALGIPFPETSERVQRLEEAVQLLRLLWTGGPVSFEGRHYQLRDAYAHPAPSPSPRIVVGGESPGGARLAARVGDAWTTTEKAFAACLGIYEEALGLAGRERSAAPVLLAVGLERELELDRQPLLNDLAAEASRWAEQGADEIIIEYVRPAAVPGLIAAAERAGLAESQAARGPAPR
ncbi:MAG: LLM class flavin-dependent oxidoreductase [Chloroflexi bacterium]|nr:LLM class flavin-dependent oxidoreductase [Chloroflexota bacterium]